jgi:hypothetical protein
MKFTEFIASILSGRDRWYAAKPQVAWLWVNRKMPKITLIRFENFERDLRSALSGLGLPIPSEIIHLNKTEGRAPNYRRYYKRCDMHAVADYYSKDLKSLGYRF